MEWIILSEIKKKKKRKDRAARKLFPRWSQKQ